jgi:hypothetical protein
MTLEQSKIEELQAKIPVRKPLLKARPTGKFIQREFQTEDIAYMSEIDGGSCNWSEMGSFKTSTCEWLIELKTKHIPNPRVLIITTKTGKGPYLESLWETLPDWDIFIAGTNKNQLVLGPRVTPWSVELPNPLYMRPVVVLAHYHCFTNRACKPQQVKVSVKLPNGKEVQRPKLNPDGTIVMTVPKCGDLLTKHWDLVVVDEAHRIKNMDSQWTRNIKEIKAPYRHVMTGTGFVNNPAEIWSLLDFVWPKDGSPHANIVGGKGYWKFREYFCEEDDYSGYRKIVGIKPHKEDEFRQLVRSVGVRRTMLECFPNITEPLETVIPVDLSPAQRRMYNGIKEYLMAMDAEGVPLHSPTVLSALNRLRQIAVATPKVKGDSWDEIKERRVIEVELTEPSSKLDAAMEVIDGLEWDDERKDQVVVFSNFKTPLDLLKVRLDKAKIPYLHLQASMSDKERYELWHEKWPKQEHQVFLCTLGVGSESINLSNAHRAIFLDQSWSPAQNKQAIGRIYRPGQTGACQLIYIRAEDTVDYRILDTVNQKHGWFTSIFGMPADIEEENGNEDDS